MLRLRTEAEVRAASIPYKVKQCMERRFADLMEEYKKNEWTYDPDRDGEFVCLENASETEGALHVFEWAATPFRELLFEVVEFDTEAECFVCVYLPGNNWGLTIFVPDFPDLPSEVWDWLMEEANGASGSTA